MTLYIGVNPDFKDFDCGGSKIIESSAWRSLDCDNDPIQVNVGDVWRIADVPDEDVCCGSPTASGFAFDDANTPDTILKNDSIQVFTISGCVLLTWETDSTGYSFAEETTTSGENTLICVDGNCGAEYDAVCNFTITDVCSGVVAGSVRNASAGAGWDSPGSSQHSLPGGTCYTSGFFCKCSYDGQRACLTISGSLWSIFQPGSDCARNCPDGITWWSVLGGTPVHPPAPYDTPDRAGREIMANQGASCGYPANPPLDSCVGGTICYPTRSDYYEWVCGGTDTPTCHFYL